jgi:hypothetical protein
MSHHTPGRGKLDLDSLTELIEREEIETVITASPVPSSVSLTRW